MTTDLARAAALAALLVLGHAVPASAQQKNVNERLQKLFDPKVIGAEATLQGEYRGKAGTKTFAAQVVARGDRRFHALVFPGGLPGDGWDGSTYAFLESAALADGVASFRSLGKDDLSASLGDSGFALTTKDDGKVTLAKVSRKSPTLGQAAPEGAVVLFDGKNLSAFQEKSTMEPGAAPTLFDGSLLAGAETKQSFKDYRLHLDFMHGFEPENIPWRRADSGVYLHQRYEVAIGDSFGFDFDLTGTAGPIAPTFFAERLLKGEKFAVFKGARSTTPPVMCGSIFRSSPKVPNYCVPPLAWQTLDIEFRAPRFDPSGKKTDPAVVSVKLNGLVVVDKQKVNGPTAHGAKGDVAEAPIWLQGYQRTVLFRNVWLVESK